MAARDKCIEATVVAVPEGHKWRIRRMSANGGAVCNGFHVALRRHDGTVVQTFPLHLPAATQALGNYITLEPDR